MPSAVAILGSHSSHLENNPMHSVGLPHSYSISWCMHWDGCTLSPYLLTLHCAGSAVWDYLALWKAGLYLTCIYRPALDSRHTRKTRTARRRRARAYSQLKATPAAHRRVTGAAPSSLLMVYCCAHRLPFTLLRTVALPCAAHGMVGAHGWHASRISLRAATRLTRSLCRTRDTVETYYC